VDEALPIEERSEPSRKRAKCRTQIDVYTNIKASLIQEDQEPTTQIPFTPSTITDNKISILNKIIECSDILSRHQCRGNKFYAQIGLEMAKLKFLYIQQCDVCILIEQDPDDIFTILNCRRCAARSNTNKFFSTIKTSINYGISYTHFLISLARLCYNYPKFKQVSVPIADISKHMRFLTDRIQEDSAFWRDD